ncbi:MAG: FtsX-like permease family protein [Planctomycetota bacterium]|jgi:putative ABC transport system permease protein
MSLWKLVRSSLVFYWRTNVGVFLAALVSTAVLVGALAVGDCVRESLSARAVARLGKIELAVAGQNRFFRGALAEALSAELKTTLAAALQVRGMISNADGSKRVNRVEVLGVDVRFFEVGGGGNPFGDDWSEAAVLNEALAARLGVGPGDEVVVRIEKASIMPRDVPLAPGSDLSIAFRLVVKAVSGADEFGEFGLQANHLSPLNVFVPIDWLADKLRRRGRANMLLAAGRAGDEVTVEKANAAIGKVWELADAGLEVRVLQEHGMVQVRTSRIFMEEHISEAALGSGEGSVGVLTYFVNELRLGEKATPYSMVTAGGGATTADMPDDEIIISQWLADDLKAKEGDLIEIAYFVLGPMRKLVEQQSAFKVRRIVAMEDKALDRELMPAFPGLADADNCRDWEPGIEIDLDKIRQRDEDYWDRYRGTPKALVTLSAGQKMWANRYGNLTAVRYMRSQSSESQIAAKLLESLEPGSVGLYFEAVRRRGTAAAGQGTDFSQLFLGFSFFLIVSALVLMGLVFVFGVESRSEQVGTFLALGFRGKLVRRLLMAEAGTLAVIGAAAGTVAGTLYTKGVLYGLSTVWRSAVSGSRIGFHVRPLTLFFGGLAGVAACLVAVWVTLRRKVRRPAKELLSGQIASSPFGSSPGDRGDMWLVAAVLLWVVSMLVTRWLGSSDRISVSTSFFVGGVVMLAAGVSFSSYLLKRKGMLKVRGFARVRPVRSVRELGFTNAKRRSGRSLAVVGLLGCGIFLVIAVAANRHDVLAGAERRDSPTGGFTLYGESSVGIVHDLTSAAGRKAVGLADEVGGFGSIQMRVRDGDDASCFNLNRAQRPRLLGVDRALADLKAFKFVEVMEGRELSEGWGLLEDSQGPDVVAAVGDYATVVWGLGKSVGEELDYTDEYGKAFRLRIVGMIADSILQGSLVISEDEFVGRFPSEDGYRVFLIDAAGEEAEQIGMGLSRGLRDYGLEVRPTVERLAAFKAVENTYLSIFGVLGGLGMILGSVGLGLVVLRNMLDRRAELAMLRAVGYTRGTLKRMVIYEHAGLLAGGLACGVVAALVAVAPALRSPGAQVPYLSLALMVAAIAASGILWVWLATTLAARGEMLAALRTE